MRVDVRSCAHCGCGMRPRNREGQSNFGRRRFCSISCLGQSQAAQRVERFWTRVDKRGADECWPWLGRRTERGYGEFSTSDKTHRAHRLALAFSGTSVPDDMLVMHSCDNRACCNPAHLSLGTYADNNHDMMKKGRDRVVGEKHPRARLTVAQVKEIKFGRRSCRSLAKEFGIHFMHAWHIRRGDAWKSVTCE